MQFNITNVLAIVAGIGAIAALIGGWLPNAQALELLFAALSVFGIRQSVSNVNLAGGISRRSIW